MLMVLGEKMKQLRIDKGMTQEALAEELHVSRSTIAKWEANVGIPDISNLKMLSKVFHFSVDDFINESKDINRETDQAFQQSSIVCDGNYYDLDLKGWNTGIFDALIVGEDKNFLFYKIQGKKENQFGLIGKKYITNISIQKKPAVSQNDIVKIDKTYFYNKHVLIELAYKDGFIKGFFDFHHDDYLDVIVHSFSESKLQLELGREIEICKITKLETL